ncbi:MAG: hypothetical protein ACLFU0_08145 [Alphaproteobacteria bacterium]
MPRLALNRLAIIIAALLLLSLGLAAARAQSAHPAVLELPALARPVGVAGLPAASSAAPAPAPSGTVGFSPPPQGFERFLDQAGLRLAGRELRFEPGHWRFSVGPGATASQAVGVADLSGTRTISSANLTAHRGNVRLGSADAAPRVGAVFHGFGGFGHRRRARLDIDLAGPGTARLATSIAERGDVDLAFTSIGRWRGFRTDGRAAVLVDEHPSGRTLLFQGSAALRDPASGWTLGLASVARHADVGAPATFYAKLGHDAPDAGPFATAWSFETAHGRDVGVVGDRAFLAGATLMQRIDDLARLHVRYRYQRLDGCAARRGAAHALLVGGSLGR